MQKVILEHEHTADEEKIAHQLIELEKAALDKWFKGDTSGYRQLWSKRSFSYCDGVSQVRIDSFEEIAKFLDGIEGKLFADSYDFCVPRVQINGSMAVLTYQLFANTTLIDMKYNCIEVFEREEEHSCNELK